MKEFMKYISMSALPGEMDPVTVPIGLLECHITRGSTERRIGEKWYKEGC
jgi:hypothetical protein